MSADKQYGVTPPISTALPSDADKQSNDALLQELRNQGTFESPPETQKRYKVLASLQTICDAFVKQVAQKREPNNAILIRDARGKIFTYGSFRLGVFGPGSDIDTLVVVPRYVTREDYFELFPGLLESMAPPGAITDLAVVTDAFVPIIKFEYSGISIDLIFSRIATLKQLPAEKDFNLKDNNLLRGLDEPELRSLNGTRVTDEILSLVPEQSTFKLALRAIKLWAQRRAIYANIMGFPGGVAWAMLVARVCQLYPKATSAVIVLKFFHILRRWPWPQPVLLKNVEDGPLQVRVWNPRVYKGDQFHLMPIITPAYPSMCATYNITKSAMRVIQQELDRGSQITDLILAKKRPWKDLFVKHTFFTTGFKYYIMVNSTSKTKEAHKVWSGFVESKVRVLVQALERHESIDLARPFNKGYDRTHRCKNDAEIERVVVGDLDFVYKEEDKVDEKAKVEIDTTSAPIKAEENGTSNPTEADSTSTGMVKGEDGDENVKLEGVPAASADSGTIIYTTTHYIGIQLVDKAKSLDLSYQVNEFKDLCTAWEKYEKELKDLCSLAIHHVRNFGLPDDVFEPGEVKPEKPVKKRAANGDIAPPSKKRSASEEQHATTKRLQQQSSVATAAAG